MKCAETQLLSQIAQPDLPRNDNKYPASMLLPRKWRNLALGMVTVTILCNILVLKQMPDSSSRTIRAVARTEELREDAVQHRESISRKLGSTKASSFSGSTGVLKRWILSGNTPSKHHENITGGQSDKQQAHSGELPSENSLEHETSEQLYNNHPRFGQQNSAARSSSKQAAKEPAQARTTQPLGMSEQPGDIASLVNNASNARPQNLVQLAEAFRQQQVLRCCTPEPMPIIMCTQKTFRCVLTRHTVLARF